MSPTRSRCGRPSTVNRKHLAEKLLRGCDAFFVEPEGFHPVDRIADEALFVQPVHGVPVEALPRAAIAGERQVEQRENHVIDLVPVHLQPAINSKITDHPFLRYSILLLQLRIILFSIVSEGGTALMLPSQSDHAKTNALLIGV